MLTAILTVILTIAFLWTMRHVWWNKRKNRLEVV